MKRLLLAILLLLPISSSAQFNGCSAGFCAPARTFSSSIIKSITPGSCTMAAAASTCTFTSLPSIDTTKSVLFYNGRNGSGAGTSYGRIGVRIAITNTTTVTATRESTTSDAVTVFFTVVEFASGVNAVYSGVVQVAVGNTSGTDSTIGHSVGANSFVIWEGLSSAVQSGADSVYQAGLTVNTGTGVVTATTGQSVATQPQNIGWMVADLDSTVVTAVSPSPLTSHTAASATDTDTVSSITTANSSLIWGGLATAASAQTLARAEYIDAITNSTTVTETRNNATDTSSRTHYFTVVQWAASALNQNVQRNTIALSAQSSNTASVTSVNTSKAFVNWNGFNGAPANINVTEPNIVLTNSTTVTAALNSTGTVNVGWELVEFK